MNLLKRTLLLDRLVSFDLRVCCYFNRHVERRKIRRLFITVSRLGDGLIWYTLILALPFVFGTEAIGVSLRMTGAGISGLIIYKTIKSLTERARPYIRNKNIVLATAPLDQYSFPSGHTLHAVSLSLIAMHYYPVLLWILAPFALLIAMSRVVLGLHFPTDVLAGAGIGFAVALLFVSDF